MKLNKKVLAILMPILIVFIAGVFMFIKEMGIGTSDSVYKINDANISEIKIDAQNVDVMAYSEFMGSNNHEIRILCDDWKDYFDIETINNTLTVRQIKDVSKKLSITVYTQTNYRGKYDVNINNGNIRFADNFILESFNCKITTGDINMHNIISDYICMVTEVGDVKAEISGNKDDYKVTSSVQNGESNLNSKQDGYRELVVKTISGNIDVKFHS